MKEKLLHWKDSSKDFWKRQSKKNQKIYIGTAVASILVIIAISFFTFNSKEKLVPLYSDLSVQEASQIKAELDSRGVAYELKDGGTTITVPENQVDTLLVELAGKGLPNNGNIDYSIFSENSSFGITDNEFNMMKLDAMQSELANLITSIEGIQKAEVMINLPEETVFVGDNAGETSAAIVLHTQPGYQFEEHQIRALYHLVSKAVPNLTEENIGIMNQYFEYFDLNSTSQYATQNSHTYQQTVKKDVERDIQRRLQQMLGAMVGLDNIIVSVTADIDFTQENRVEELVEPVDIENMEGLPVSLETIQESYTGNPPEGGTVGAGEDDVPNYPGAASGDNGDYEFDKEMINYEFNRIRKEIVESPYKIRDLGIQVAVDNVKDVNGEETEFLTLQEQSDVEEGIGSILESIVSTSIDTTYGEVETDNKYSIVFQEFSGNPVMEETESPAIPTWVYIVAGILLVLIILLIFLLIRSRRGETEEVVEEISLNEFSEDVPDLPQQKEDESIVRRKQLEKIAQEKPEDFAKLLRSWIGED
ncbi:flagellar M-ring protein FliF [Oceanobacillus luteolus]|uniref:Flagellar M-ring protein n=1 Tax=Oceanobacillus luteolus TaxID=1274358 RepID=A0ABW4HRC7_9BACI|nr:flagellar basal-body MS-ring/collar protein FliF [Oceanobacillus luteolus]MCM3739050.1 flagellar M-ring protein FliF [Oceanobacillus luteolus]